jgi:hypothetical protein
MIKIRKYIKKTRIIITERRETLFFNSINVFIKDPLPENVPLNPVLRKVESIIPRHMAYNIDAVYVGDFEHLKEREINALYQDGALYISNIQDDVVDLLDDIIHEISHATEEKYGPEIYGDGLIEQEYLNKKERLYEILKSYEYNVDYNMFMQTEYSQEFDDLLYKEIGYEKLDFLTTGLFLNNYSVTSVREYFATGFERYFLGNAAELSGISPYLYQKIDNLNNLENQYR